MPKILIDQLDPSGAHPSVSSPTLDEDRIDEKSCFANNYQHIGCYYYVEGDVALLQYIDVLHNVTQANENLGEEIFLRRWCHVQLMVKMMLVLVST